MLAKYVHQNKLINICDKFNPDMKKSDCVGNEMPWVCETLKVLHTLNAVNDLEISGDTTDFVYRESAWSYIYHPIPEQHYFKM